MTECGNRELYFGRAAPGVRAEAFVAQLVVHKAQISMAKRGRRLQLQMKELAMTRGGDGRCRSKLPERIG